jgi:very-short-patch-repair endonuclease
MDCLHVIIRSRPAREAFAAVESALRQGIVTRAEWGRVLAGLRHGERRALRCASFRSESGGESLLLFDLLRSALQPAQQVEISGVGRVDFVLGARLILEVDGAEFHSSRAEFEEDRRRDAVASTLGLRVLRFSHNQIERHDPVVMNAILAAVRRGDHG